MKELIKFVTICSFLLLPKMALSALVQVKSLPWAGFFPGGSLGDIILNESCPAVVDVENDGDLDVLVGESTGELYLYTQDSPENFTEVSHFASIDVGFDSCPDVVDWNVDGHFDIVVGNEDGQIKLFLNNGQNIFSENPIFATFDVGSRAMPSVVDWDADGDFDVVVGNNTPNLSLFTNNGSDQFVVTSNFVSIVEFGQVRPDTIDWDGDNDLDLIVGNGYGTISLYVNNGSGTFSRTADYGGIDLESSSTPFVIDWNQDGLFDLLIGDVYGKVNLFLSIGSGVFTRSQEFEGLDVGVISRPAVVDWDGDGKLDVFSTSGLDGTLILFTQIQPDTFSRTDNYANLTRSGLTISVVDWEKNGGDGDLDFIVNDGFNNYELLRNSGSNSFTSTAFTPAGLSGTTYPQAIDYDGDGDNDIIAGNINGRTDYIENLGTIANMTTHLNYFGIDVGSAARPFLVDWNSDGFLDLFIGDSDGTFELYLDDGSESFASHTADLDGLNVGGIAAPYVIDWDADGDLDVVSGALSGRIYLFQTDGDGDGYVGTDDCDDHNAAINVHLIEICGDSIDNDCDGHVDVPPVWYQDGDNDGFGLAGATQSACAQPVGYVSNSLDCSDANSLIFPAAAEICDAVDNDCDALVDENITVSQFYQDIDQDGFGNKQSAIASCLQPVNYISDATDCDDTRSTVAPGITELCSDELDNDCDGNIDDADSDCAVAPVVAPISQSGASETAACGNSVIDGSEECDDGNTISGDGCSLSCIVENVTSATNPNNSSSTAGSSGGCSLNPN